jgi:hypothetical protein
VEALLLLVDRQVQLSLSPFAVPLDTLLMLFLPLLFDFSLNGTCRRSELLGERPGWLRWHNPLRDPG